MGTGDSCCQAWWLSQSSESRGQEKRLAARAQHTVGWWPRITESQVDQITQLDRGTVRMVWTHNTKEPRAEVEEGRNPFFSRREAVKFSVSAGLPLHQALQEPSNRPDNWEVRAHATQCSINKADSRAHITTHPLKTKWRFLCMT